MAGSAVIAAKGHSQFVQDPLGSVMENARLSKQRRTIQKSGRGLPLQGTFWRGLFRMLDDQIWANCRGGLSRITRDLK